MQLPFITFLLGQNEKKIRQGVAVAGSPSSVTATGGTLCTNRFFGDFPPGTSRTNRFFG
jgi:hypothetical protein